MRDYERYAARITEQIFEGDNAFFLEAGIDLDKAKPFDRPGTYGGISYGVKGPKIRSLEIVLEASDLYSVQVFYVEPGQSNVISIHTKKPVEISRETLSTKVDRVFAFDLVEVLHSLFYRGGAP